MSGSPEKTTSNPAPLNISPQLQAEVVSLLANPSVKSGMEQAATKYLPQTIDFGYAVLHDTPDGTVNTAGTVAELQNNPALQQLEKQTGVDLSTLNGVQKISKTDSGTGVNIDIQSSKNVDLGLSNVLPGLSLEMGKDTSFTVEDPKGSGQLTLDNFKNVQMSVDGVTFDPTKVTVDQAKDGNPEFHVQGTAGGVLPLAATIEVKNGKPTITGFQP